MSCEALQRSKAMCCNSATITPGNEKKQTCLIVSFARSCMTLHAFRSREAGRATDLGERLMKNRSEEHTSELQSPMRISYAVFCLKTKQHANQLRRFTS